MTEHAGGTEVSMTGHWKSLWIFSLFISNILNQITGTSAVYGDFEDSNEDDWRPVFHDIGPSPHSPRRYPLFSQVYTVPATALRPAATKKAYLQVLSNANKIESYSPPSILGPLSDFGHSTVKAKRPIVLNKTNGGNIPLVNQNAFDQPTSSQNQVIKLPVRYENLGYSAALLPPPVLPSATPYRPDSQEADTQESVNQQYQSYRDAAFLLKTVRPPPPVEHSYRFGSSSGSSPSSYFFSNNANVPQSQGLSAYHLSSKDNQKSQATNYNSPFLIGGQSIYGPPSPVYPVVLRPAISTIHHQNLGEQFVLRPQSHVKNTEEAVLKRRPVTLYSGDINSSKNLLSPEVLGNAKRPDNTEAPLTPTKSPGKQVFDQLSHYARPFQSSNHREKDEQGKPFITSHQYNIPTGQRPNWSNGSKQKTKGQVFGLGTIGANSVQSHTYEPEKPYVAQSQTPAVYPVSVTTVDISAASPEAVTFVPYTDSQLKDNFRPSHYYYQTTTVRPQENHNYVFNKNKVFSTPASHINVVSEEEEYPTFLPTPTSDVRPFTFHSGNGQQAVSGYSLESSFQKSKNKYTQENQESNSQVDAVTRTPDSHRRRRPTAATRAPIQYVEEQFTVPATEYPQTEQQDTEAPTVVSYTEPSTTLRSRRRKPTSRYKVKPPQEEIPSINFNQEISNSDFNGQNIFTQFVDYSTSPPDYSNINNNNHNYNANNNIYSSNNQNYPTGDGGDVIGGEETGGDNHEANDNYPNNIKQHEAEPSTTTTTTTTAAPTPTSRIRNRFKYGNNTRPRFSVKDYKERLKVSSTPAPETNDPIDDTNERKEILKTRFATRNKLANKVDSVTKNTTDSDSKSELPAKKYKPRVRPNRYRTTSTQSVLESLSTTTTTERPAFKPSSTPSRYKNGVSKYYSRYRTSTEAPTSNSSSDAQPSSSTKNPVKLKGVFSAKRRPFPIKTAASQIDENKNDENDTPSNTRGDETLGEENEIAPQVTKKADNFVISSAVLKGEESLISPEVATKPLDDVSMEYDEEEEDNAAATKVADLTSSSTNLQKQPIQNEVSSTNNRRTLPRITIATDDPILPIEAFFQSSRPSKSDRVHR